MSTYTTNRNYEKPAHGDYPGTWEQWVATILDAIDADIVDASIFTTGNLPIARMPTGGTWNLSSILSFAGTIEIANIGTFKYIGAWNNNFRITNYNGKIMIGNNVKFDASGNIVSDYYGTTNPSGIGFLSQTSTGSALWSIIRKDPAADTYEYDLYGIGGNVGLRTSTEFGSGVGVLSLLNATTNPSGILTNAALFYASGGEMYVYDAGGTATLISPHAPEIPAEITPSKKFPAVSYEENKIMGVRRWIAKCKAYELIEELAKKAGLLGVDESIIKIETITPQDPDEVEVQKKQQWKQQWKEKNKVKKVVDKADAFEEYTKEVEDKDSIVDTKVQYELDLDAGDVKQVEVPAYKKVTVTKKRLKDGVVFDANTGEFHKMVHPDDAEVEVAANANAKEWKLPIWVKENAIANIKAMSK